MAGRKSRTPPSRRVRELERRLHEAEETIQAIRDGHVEALVVRTMRGEEIFTLRSADQPYRLMVEQMREGALTLSADGTILYCNNRFAELVASPAERVAGRMFTEFVAPDDQQRVKTLLLRDAFRDEVQLRSSTDLLNPAQISSIALKIDDVRTTAVVVTDLTHERVERG